MGRMGEQLTRILASLLHTAADKSGLDGYIDQHIGRRMESIANASQGTQTLLTMLYRDRAERHLPPPSFDDVEFRAYSQNGEDGILLYLFALLGASTKRCVEICCGSGLECNSANLIINHGWRGLLVDGDETLVQSATEFYRSNRSTSWFPPYIVHAWVTAENVDQLIKDCGFAGDIDLLSLDLDGIDYWIWKAMESVSPRVVLAEYNWTWGPIESKTVPYKTDFTMTRIYTSELLLRRSPSSLEAKDCDWWEPNAGALTPSSCERASVRTCSQKSARRRASRRLLCTWCGGLRYWRNLPHTSGSLSDESGCPRPPVGRSYSGNSVVPSLIASSYL